MRAAVVFNPTKSGNEQLRNEIRMLEEQGVLSSTLWVSTEIGDSGHAAAREALTEHVDVVIAAGGDGTVRAVAAELRGSGVALGIIPMGTGNLLARTLGIPMNDVAEALKVAITPGDTPIDVVSILMRRDGGETHRTVSLVLAGAGIDAAMVANTNEQLKKWVGWVAYVDAILRSLPQMVPFCLRVRINGRESHSKKASAVFVANLGDLPGNLSVVPDAELDDGELDVVVLQPRRPLDWIFIWRRFSWENPVLRRSPLGRKYADRFKGRRRDQILYFRSHEVSLTFDSPQEFQVDGDSFGQITSLHAVVERQSLVLRVPHDD